MTPSQRLPAGLASTQLATAESAAKEDQDLRWRREVMIRWNDGYRRLDAKGLSPRSRPRRSRASIVLESCCQGAHWNGANFGAVGGDQGANRIGALMDPEE